MVDTQLIDEMIVDLKNVQKILKKYSRLGIPQIERSIRSASMNLHMILWESGEGMNYRPDLPIDGENDDMNLR